MKSGRSIVKMLLVFRRKDCKGSIFHKIKCKLVSVVVAFQSLDLFHKLTWYFFVIGAAIGNSLGKNYGKYQMTGVNH